MIQIKPNYFKINKVYFHGSALMSFPDIFKNLYHFISKVTRRDYRDAQVHLFRMRHITIDALVI